MGELQDIYGEHLVSQDAQGPITKQLALYTEASWMHNPLHGAELAERIVDLEARGKALSDFVAAERIGEITSEEALAEAFDTYMARYDELPDAVLYQSLMEWKRQSATVRELRKNAAAYVSLQHDAQEKFPGRELAELEPSELGELSSENATFGIGGKNPLYIVRPEQVQVETLCSYGSTEGVEYADAVTYSQYANGVLIEVLTNMLLYHFQNRFGGDVLEGGASVLLEDLPDESYETAQRYARRLPESLQRMVENGLMRLHMLSGVDYLLNSPTDLVDVVETLLSSGANDKNIAACCLTFMQGGLI